MSDTAAATSGGATVLAAAYDQYVSSDRTPSDWTDFVETVGHAMAPLSHAFPAGQPAITAGTLTELPRTGLSASDAASGASGNLQRCPAATFEALLDELFLAQGQANSHHTGVADSVRAGSSIPLGGLSDLRLMSSTCYRSLKDLFVVADPTLEALFAQYRDVGGAAAPGGYHDLLQGLILLSTRWKRFLFFREDPLHYATQSRVLFSVLDELLTRNMLTHGEYDFIETVLYTQTHGTEAEGRYGDEAHVADGATTTAAAAASLAEHGESEFLMAAWSIAYETLSPESGASAAQQGKAVAEFYDSLLHLLEKQVALIYTRYTREAALFLQQVARNTSASSSPSSPNKAQHAYLPPASLRHLHRLLEHQQVLDARKQRGGIMMKSRDDPMMDEVFSKQCASMFAAFAESAQTQNSLELLETLSIIGAAWKKDSPHGVLLNCLAYLQQHHLINPQELHTLECMVYEEEQELMDAWSLYASIDHDADAAFTKKCFDRLVRDVRRALERALKIQMDQLARQGYALVNQWSVAPDPVPTLFADPQRMAAVGLPSAVELDAPIASFELPVELHATLSQAHSIVLRDLCARRDPVFMALLQQHAESGDLEEMLDGLERLLAREIAATNGEQRLRNGGMPQSRSLEDEDLDVYQLCQMLSSLHNSGYLSSSALAQLIHAVREQRDPFLLASFAMYKEGLSRGANQGGGGGGGSGGVRRNREMWGEMWNSITLVWRRIQRDMAHEAAAAAEAEAKMRTTAAARPSRRRAVATVASPAGDDGTDALSLHGAEVIDALSASSVIPITATLYLRDLLRAADARLMAILSMHASDEMSEEEMVESMVMLSSRWQAELPAPERDCARLLTRLSRDSKLFSPRALDYLLGLLYARDTTLAAVYSLYADTLQSTAHEDAQEEEENEAAGATVSDEEEHKYADAPRRNFVSGGSFRRIAQRERALAEFVDTLRAMLIAGNRTITALNNGEAKL